jgi:AraC family transcriptional regulator, exoenzyme S synthesis regulatory protein ExsA
MFNAIEALRSPAAPEMLPGLRKFEIGELLFACFTCPATEGWEASWAEHDRIVHIASGTKALRTLTATYEIGPGDTLFLKKGACFVRQLDDDELCMFMYFIPDDFIRTVVREIASDLPTLPPSAELREMAIRMQDDTCFQAFQQAMALFFGTRDAPSEVLLKLKMKELIAGIVVSRGNPLLSSYLRHVASRQLPSVAAIMEANCCQNLSLDDFAKLCHRSLSRFKRDFREHFGIAPGRWLLERRLECSARLLMTTNLSVTAIVFECGFEQPSHFSRAFKAKYGQAPREYRDACVAAARHGRHEDKSSEINR